MKKFFTKWFIVPEADRTKNEIFIWWEKRRLIFNLFYCLTFCISLSIHFYISNLVGFPMDFSDSMLILLVPFFILFANIAYFSGWGIQVLLHKIFQGKLDKVLKYLFVLFLTGTVVIALYYPGIVGILWYFGI